MEEIIEGGAVIRFSPDKKISKKMPVFYNPVMKLNRDMSVAFLRCFEKSQMQIGLPLAATGIRGIRLLLELNSEKIKSLQMNDISADAVKLMKENAKLNGVENRAEIFNLDANCFVIGSNGFDYIDIDPFGSPNFLLDSCAKRVSRGGIIAVTATDTAPLCGTYRKACIRKYSSIPIRNEFYNEAGVRILIKKVQEVAAQYDKALRPLVSYAKEHYFRIFFQCMKNKGDVDNVMKDIGYLLFCSKCLFRKTSANIFNQKECPDCGSVLDYGGPMWLGELCNSSLLKKMHESCEDNKLSGFLRMLYDESVVGTVGFYDISAVCKKHRISRIPKKELILSRIRFMGFRAEDTHFRPNSVRSDISIMALVKILKETGK